VILVQTDEERKARRKEVRDRPENKAKRKEQRDRPETKAKRKEYNVRPERIAKQKERASRPETKAKVKAREQTPEHKAKRKKYEQRPERIAKQKERAANPENKAKKKDYEQIPEVKADREKTRLERRLNVLQTYSKRLSNSDIPCCNCCGENSHIEFLAIDHIAGKKQMDSERGLIKLGYSSKLDGNGLVNWLIHNDFPEGFQILCHNCNLAKGHYGKCPHKRK